MLIAIITLGINACQADLRGDRKPEIVCALLNSSACLSSVGCRDADDSLRSEKCSGCLNGHIVLTDMNAICSNSKRNVEAVINQEGHAVLSSRGSARSRRESRSDDASLTAAHRDFASCASRRKSLVLAFFSLSWRMVTPPWSACSSVSSKLRFGCSASVCRTTGST